MASVPWQLGLPGERLIHHGVRATAPTGIADADAAARAADAVRLAPADDGAASTGTGKTP